MDFILSIIIANYNSSKYLDKAIDFLSHIPEWVQVIFVDDCSTDDSLEKCQKTLKGDNYLFLKTPTNSGPGIARNIGLENSKGKYITFLDSDDYCSDSFFDTIYPFLEQDKDCLMFDYNYVSKNNKIRKKEMFPSSLEFTKTNILLFTRGCTWGKIYKKEIILKHDIRFPKLNRNEDVAFTRITLSFCQSFAKINNNLYYYVQHKGSLMSSNIYNSKNNFIAFETISTYFKHDNKEELEAIFANDFFCTISLQESVRLKKRQWESLINDSLSKHSNLLENKYYEYFPKNHRMILKESYKLNYFKVKMFNKLKRVLVLLRK